MVNIHPMAVHHHAVGKDLAGDMDFPQSIQHIFPVLGSQPDFQPVDFPGVFLQTHAKMGPGVVAVNKALQTPGSPGNRRPPAQLRTVVKGFENFGPFGVVHFVFPFAVLMEAISIARRLVHWASSFR